MATNSRDDRIPARRRLNKLADHGYAGNFRRDPSQLELQLKLEAARAARAST